MTSTRRPAVTEALQAIGWTADDITSLPVSVTRHPRGAVFAVPIGRGDCFLDTPDGASIRFPASVPDSVVIAACMAAADQDPTASLALDLMKERDAHARTCLAWKSARRRAARRQPNEREGLIFQLERWNHRLEGMINLANEAARVSAEAGQEAAADAYRLRERVGHLQARVRELEAAGGAQAGLCGRERSTGQPCPDHPRPEPARPPVRPTRQNPAGTEAHDG